MTTIFYDGKNLHADKRIVLPCFPSRTSDDGLKVFVNDKKDIAYAVAGELLSDKWERRMLESVLFMLMSDIYKNGFTDRVDKESYFDKINIFDTFIAVEQVLLKEHSSGYIKSKINKLKSSIKNICSIVMTSDITIFIGETYIYPQTGYMCSFGTGQEFIMPSYYVTQDAKIAFRLTSELDSLTSEEFDTIYLDSLVPFEPFIDEEKTI